MPSKWRTVQLGEITDWYSGGTPPKDDAQYWGGSIPWISASSMSGHRYSNSDMKLTDAGLARGSRLAEIDTILLLVRGSMLHQHVPVGIALCPVAFNQDVKAIRAKGELNPWFLLYWFLGKERELLKLVEFTGIGAGKFNTKQLQELSVYLPPIEEQEQIVAVAKSLDDKIELNRQINQTLEQIAQAIFRSWFVDFEPVKAKIAAKENGQDPERAAMRAISGKSDEELDQLGSEQYQQLAATASLLPDKFEQTETGPIPEEWKSGSYESLYSERKEKAKDKNDVFVLSAMQTGELKMPSDVFDKQVHSEDISKYKVVQPGDLAFNPSRINIGSAGFNDFYFIGAVSPVYTVLGLKDIEFSAYVRMHLKLSSTKEWINTLCSGSVRQSLSVKDFLSIPVVLPSKELNSAFVKIYENLNRKIIANKKEITTLTSLRDALLPQLLSGEISISGSEATAEAAA